MYALITGASSGIGKEMAYSLAKRGYNLILVARRVNILETIKNEIKAKYDISIDIYECDVTDLTALNELVLKYPNIDILINNAGFGKVGTFESLPLEDSMKMIDLNVKSLQYLTKKYYDKMDEKKSGSILNVSSVAAFQSGPLMATYYATKAYVLSLSEALYFEAKKKKNNVVVSCLCPGPTKTEFDDVAGVSFSLKGDSASMVAEKAIKGLLKKKKIIIPTFKLRFLLFIERLLPRDLVLKVIYKSQKSKNS